MNSSCMSTVEHIVYIENIILCAEMVPIALDQYF